jgi:hypothetical protein
MREYGVLGGRAPPVEAGGKHRSAEADRSAVEHPKHRKRAIAIGKKIGLYRDWPVSKGCTPPYVPVWVEAMVKRKG